MIRCPACQPIAFHPYQDTWALGAPWFWAVFCRCQALPGFAIRAFLTWDSPEGLCKSTGKTKN
jgi:hypothetical protein